MANLAASELQTLYQLETDPMGLVSYEYQNLLNAGQAVANAGAYLGRLSADPCEQQRARAALLAAMMNPNTYAYAVFGIDSALAAGFFGPEATAAETGATQLEFNFAKDFGQNSRLVIGRGPDLSAPGALGVDEYKLGWFSVQSTSGMDAEWAVNQAMPQNVMNLNLPIRNASSLLDTAGFYLNNERSMLQSAGSQQPPFNRLRKT